MAFVYIIRSKHLDRLRREDFSESPPFMAARGLTSQPSSSSKSQTKRETSLATRDLYQYSSPSSLTDRDKMLQLRSKMRNERLAKLGQDSDLDLKRLELKVKMAKERNLKLLGLDFKSETNREISLQENLLIRWKEAIFGRQIFNYIRMKGNTSEQEKCGVCLEELRNGRSLDRLPCGHKFHSYCLRPGLPENPTCPNCRTGAVLQHSLQHLKID